MKGKFIVLYGPNNLGKSVQAQRLGQNLAKQLGNENVLVIKYPIYELPTGQRINSDIRHHHKMSPYELQKEYAANRNVFEPTLVSYLQSGIWVVAEDYSGTGKAWGIVEGLDLEKLEEINKGQLEPDVSILIDGQQRYSQSIERGHRFEDSDKWDNARKVHLELASLYGWEIVNANQPVDKVENDIWEVVSSKLQEST